MTQDYFNPNAINPGSGWKPQGFLGGMMHAEDRMRYEQMSDLQKQMIHREMERKRMEDETYRLDADKRAAERPAAISGHQVTTAQNQARLSNPDHAPSVAMGEIGDNQVKASKGYVAKNTQDSEAAFKNADNLLKAMESSVDRLNTVSGGLQSQEAWDQVSGTLPASIRSHYGDVWRPDLTKRIEADAKRLSENIALRREKAKIGYQSDRDVAKAKAMGEEQMKREREVTERNVEVAWIRAGIRTQADRKRVEDVVAKSLEKIFSGQKLTPQEAFAFRTARNIMNQVKAAAAGADRTQMQAGMMGLDASRPMPNVDDIPEDFIDRGAPSPDPQPKPQEAQTKQKAIDAWGAYEPDKYDYGINPETNKFARKPKGK